MEKKIFSQKNDENGQAITEFVLSLLVLISFFFFFIKMCAVFAVGNFIHYATFMGARTYLSSDKTPDQQTANAEQVMKDMIGSRWKTWIIRNNSDNNSSVPGVKIGAGDFASQMPLVYHWNQGVTFSFNPIFTLYPWSKSTGQGFKLKLSSESWLGREESTSECMQAKQQVQKNLTGTPVGNTIEWDQNNGC